MANIDLGWILMKCPGCRTEWSVQYLKATREVPRCPSCSTPGYAIGTSTKAVTRSVKSTTTRRQQ